MIRFALRCAADHAFESWFPSGAAYDEQAAVGLIECPVCGSKDVSKALMAPSLAKADRERAGREKKVAAKPDPTPQSAGPAVAEAGAPVALASEGDRAMRAMLRAFREHVVANADNVGRRFAEEARKMHYGEVEHRSIYGEANAAEAHELWEEGIEVHAIPLGPDDRH